MSKAKPTLREVARITGLTVFVMQAKGRDVIAMTSQGSEIYQGQELFLVTTPEGNTLHFNSKGREFRGGVYPRTLHVWTEQLERDARMQKALSDCRTLLDDLKPRLYRLTEPQLIELQTALTTAATLTAVKL
jgi:hypothetical protein